jgi:uridine phosphorylase
VSEISWYFDEVETRVHNREFITHTGTTKGKRITVLSTGIGTDNIDIVINELDALANIDLEARMAKPHTKSLNIIRIGTSGSIQPDIPVNAFSLSTYGMGLDNLMRYYLADKILEQEMEESFLQQTGWPFAKVFPYFVKGSDSLIRLFSEGTTPGITATAPGFYAPQGRSLRLNLPDEELIARLQKFNYNGQRIINFEMETSALYGLGALLGHNVVTVCALIANRATLTYSSAYKPVIKKLVELVLERLTQDESNG